MRIVILTTSAYGTAGHHLPILALSKEIDIAAVVLSEGIVLNRKKRYSRTFKKIFRIGLFGAVNGISMRKWYNEDLDKYCKIRSIEETCKQQNIRLDRVPSTNSRKTQQVFSELKPDLALSLGNGYISPKVFNIPKFGMLNVHHEILPDYQNAQSVIWQLYNGSCETGYTIHKIDAHIDTGDIIFQERVPICFKETLSETVTATLCQLFDRSADGLREVLEHFDAYAGKAYPQGAGKKYTTPSYWQYLKIVRNFKRLKQQSIAQSE